jgi:hypothetical protein
MHARERVAKTIFFIRYLLIYKDSRAWMAVSASLLPMNHGQQSSVLILCSIGVLGIFLMAAST